MSQNWRNNFHGGNNKHVYFGSDNNKNNKQANSFRPFNNERQRSRDNFNSNNNKIKPAEQYSNSIKVTRQITPLDIGNPKIYLLWKWQKQQQAQNTLKNDKNNQSNKQNISTKKLRFRANIIKHPHPSKRVQSQSSRLNQLKNQITPVQQIWGQLVKQSLNDSQFVQIYRKKNSLAYDDIEYTKSIIKYDGFQNNKKYYNNQNSQYNIFSRAYFKLWEILSLGILDKKKDEDINIANLAEGPGGFIHSIIDFRLRQNKALQDRYFAITLKIQQGKTRNAKDWSDFRGSRFFQDMKKQGYKIKLSYGQTGDGNLYDIGNIDSFKTHVMQGREAFLVTGDGGIECIGDDQFHYQQLFNAKLFFSQILTALRIQQIGGVFILKIYDIHFQLTQQILMLLCVFYRKVGIIKPLTSRPGNSQKYVLCEGFNGVTREQLQLLTSILKQWHLTQNKLSYFQNTSYIHSILQFFPQFQSQRKLAQQQTKPIFKQTILQRIKLINDHLAKQQEMKIQQGLELIKRHNGNKYEIKKEIKEKRFGYQLNYAYEWCRKYGLKTVDVKVKGNNYSN